MSARRRTARGSLASVQRRRLMVLAGFVIAAYAALGARAVQLQALDADWLARRAQLQRSRTLEFSALRGQIVDRTGLLLAMSAGVDSVAASPRLVRDRALTARQLHGALGVPLERISAQLDPSRGFAWISRWITPDQAQRVRKLELAGVRLQSERKRFYPNRGLAASYLGFAGRDGEGLSGIELAFDAVLRGEAARVAVQRDGRGRVLMPADSNLSMRRGARLVLALDAKLQARAEQVLAHGQQETQATHLSLVAIDPRNGDVLALAEAPGFNPNRFWEADPGAFRTRGFVDAFEPGSTLKPFTVALALEAGVVTPDEPFDCEGGRWRVRDRIIRDWRPHGILSVREIVAQSSNIGAAKIADRLGSRRLVEGLARFGFGVQTHSGFPGEANGVLHSIREAQAVERANLAFGQGLTATALQLATAGAVLANGGLLVRPRLALRLERGDETIEFPADPGVRVLESETAATVLAMLRAAVAHGTGGGAALRQHQVAGKTGTAQKVVNGRYSNERFVASFLGIVPVDNPQIVIVVVVDEPRFGRHTGGGVAAPIFRKVARHAARNFAAAGPS